MFQGQQRDQQPKANGRNVAPPVDAPYPSGPWDTDRELWADAVAADHEGQLIYLLLRPFMRDALDGIQLGHDLMSLKLPPSLEEPDLSATHTPLHLAHRSEGQGLTRLLMYNESVKLTVRTHQQQFIVQQPDNFYIKQLDVGVLRCVGSALGQSCALDFYSAKVDAALQLAQSANLRVMQTGMFKANVNFKQVIAYCSLIHGAVISQLGLMDKNDLAWQYAKYDKMVEIMRAEFELDKRIRHLQDKIEVVARNAATFVSFQQNDKSHLLEVLIVVLIGLEIAVSLTDMGLRTFANV